MWKKNDGVKCKNCIHLNVCDGLYFNLDTECLRSCGYFEEKPLHCPHCGAEISEKSREKMKN